MDNNNKSQIFHHGYEKWQGDRSQNVPPWFLIGTASLRNIWTSSGCLVRWSYIIFFIIYIFNILYTNIIRHQFENLKKVPALKGLVEAAQASLDQPEIWFHKSFILWPAIIFSLLTMLTFGGQLISKDKAANALQVYFSKSVSQWDYILGKFFSIAVICSTVTLIPSAIMILLGLIFGPDISAFIAESWNIPLLTGLYWLILTLSIGIFALFFSSMFTKGYMASIGFIGFLLFSEIMALLLVRIFGNLDFLVGINWIKSIHDLGEVIFDLKIQSGSLLLWQMINLGVIATIMFFKLTQNIRPVEVVK